MRRADITKYGSVVPRSEIGRTLFVSAWKSTRLHCVIAEFAMAIGVLEICLVGALVGLGYISMGGEAATASALADGLLEQKRDDDAAVAGEPRGGDGIVGRRGAQMRNIERGYGSGRGKASYDPHDQL